MRKAGLHKQISSIFDGVPIPGDNKVSESTESSASMLQTQDPPEAVSAVDTAHGSVPQETQSASVQQVTTDPPQSALVSPLRISRPMPMPKTAIAKTNSGPGLGAQARRALLGADKKSLDARQKKMVGLIGVLSVVFAVVMFMSFGGVGGAQATPEDHPTAPPVNAAVSAKANVRDWQNPEPLSGLRDATVPLSNAATTQHPDDTQVFGAGNLVVKGIVFSKNPSAIINDQIINEGQAFQGVRIVKITKESVEFEADGKRWTQQVQR